MNVTFYFCTCVCSHCVYSRTNLAIRIHVCGWDKLHLTVRKRAPCSQALPAWCHARDEMYQALPLLSLGMRLKKDSSKIIKFIDVFFLCRKECALDSYITYWYRYLSVFWFQREKGRLCKMCFSQYQALSVALERPEDGDCYLCEVSQLAGLVWVVSPCVSSFDSLYSVSHIHKALHCTRAFLLTCNTRRFSTHIYTSYLCMCL